MKTILTIILISFTTVIFAQNFLLEETKGIRSIAYITHKGNTGAVKTTINKTFEYHPSGLISKVKYKTSASTYEESEGTLIYKNANTPNCILKHEIIKNEKEYILKTSEVPPPNNQKSECSYSPEYPVFGNEKFDSLFQDVEITLPKMGRVHYVMKRRFLEEGGFMDISYVKNYGKLKLSIIKKHTFLNDELVLVQLFARSGSNIYLEEQKVEDKHGSYIKKIKTKEVYQPSENAVSNYDYEYDEKGNWIKKSSKFPKEGKVYFEERKILYY